MTATETTDAAARVVLDPARLARAGARRDAAFARASAELDAVLDGIIAAGGPDAPGVNLTAIAAAMGIARPTLYRMLKRRGVKW